jgi:glycolate oxidase FAD binding subunit
MNTPLLPGSVTELVEAVRSTPRLIAFGAGTKPRLSAVNVPKLSTERLRGIIEYEPSEFTFTALAGTPLREIVAALAERGQYLPFDPPLVATGATIGGTVAAGLSGPGRFRFGGVRDFILGGKFVDGAGRLLRMGGKVVKNAAGFDLPKFFVGSLGRFGVLAELTFKVFPIPPSKLTLRLNVKDIAATSLILIEAANTRWELDALEVLPGGKAMCLRLAGPEPALQSLSKEIFARWPGAPLSVKEADAVWTEIREFSWACPSGPLVKIATTPNVLSQLVENLGLIDGVRFQVSAGGQMAFVSLPADSQFVPLAKHLRALGLPAMTLRGTGPLWCGAERKSQIEQAVKRALDAENRFPVLNDE